LDCVGSRSVNLPFLLVWAKTRSSLPNISEVKSNHRIRRALVSGRKVRLNLADGRLPLVWFAAVELVCRRRHASVAVLAVQEKWLSARQEHRGSRRILRRCWSAAAPL
jgi:hypothetical protein